ncbi:hypothetical protein KIN20_004093 [Parelaphostrongylus tenuis]|uniref:Uncharacterized protein n=1 Tax=Parelaphostrongylus tenuis TaxID=148309 RepID=A0AAD5MGR0_PARTN|nr:hypothetical protein KIN20_004093 [Parelaphostrongylus tenuis]
MSGSNHGSRPTTCNTPIKLSTHPYSQIRKGDQCGSRMTPLSAPGPEPFPNKAPWRTYAGYESFCHPFGMYQPYAVPPTTQSARGQFCDTQQSLWHYGTQQTPSATVQRSATPSMDQSPSEKAFLLLLRFSRNLMQENKRERSDSHGPEILACIDTDAEVKTILVIKFFDSITNMEPAAILKQHESIHTL